MQRASSFNRTCHCSNSVFPSGLDPAVFCTKVWTALGGLCCLAGKQKCFTMKRSFHHRSIRCKQSIIALAMKAPSRGNVRRTAVFQFL